MKDQLFLTENKDLNLTHIKNQNIIFIVNR
ncbi:hypothetical protein SAMN05216269_103251 [Flavobacterium xinjiangense]|uniref:Uncharacterized protein n=1 Tax=Flavobacterium xinjiangense TaxID=178356 RepID=A0A1M7HE80_9FLAO|nr:hypothetical protein SAMN05216269_103251 [Flavobacterium xinjiangense]